jgi:hypothetical protein
MVDEAETWIRYGNGCEVSLGPVRGNGSVEKRNDVEYCPIGTKLRD